ncbi:MAG: histidine phosphatase family protein [Candidatus Diapherotrites archaeon]|nr:histidine phosphatase family protein [Candidatus Diapherotrites archaeon]
MKIYLCRHGETIWNKEGRLQGQANVPLNETGMAQAFALAAYLKKKRFDAAYSSDLTRARQTLQEILRLHPSIKPSHQKQLREINVGIYEGHTALDIKAKNPADYFKRIEFKYDFFHPQGESYRGMDEKRVQPFLKRLLKMHAKDHVLLVGHEGLNRIILCRLMGLDPSQHVLRQPHECVYELEGQKDGFSCGFVMPALKLKGRGLLYYP